MSNQASIVDTIVQTHVPNGVRTPHPRPGSDPVPTQAAKPKNKKVVLDLNQTVALADYLRKNINEFRQGVLISEVADCFNKSAADLEGFRPDWKIVNRNHVQYALEQLGLKLPEAPAAAITDKSDLLARIERLERMVFILSKPHTNAMGFSSKDSTDLGLLSAQIDPYR